MFLRNREFINKIQNERKNISLEVTDKIEIQIENKESFIIESLSKHKDFICNEVQALKFLINENINESNIMDLNIHNLEFYKFYRSLEVYRSAFKTHQDLMIIDPNSEFFKYFRSPESR